VEYPQPTEDVIMQDNRINSENKRIDFSLRVVSIGAIVPVAAWDEKGKKVTDNLDGDDSRVIMDRALPFIRKAADSETPFLAVIWFHAPHLPCVASPELFAHYRNFWRSSVGIMTVRTKHLSVK